MVRDNACKLKLPESLSIQPLVNVSQLKKYHCRLQRPLPIEVDGEEEHVVHGILDQEDRADATQS